VGIFCDKERGSPTAIVREVSVRGSAAREGSIRPGDEVVSVDGNSIAQWSAATLRNALQVQSLCVYSIYWHRRLCVYLLYWYKGLCVYLLYC
jgi:hypothetical protein